MTSSRVSVIIPAYRAAKTIRRAIDSVLTQTVPAAEVIVVDDGSPDDQAAVVAEYGERVTLIRKPNGGAASARNAGIERATGDFIAFLDADDYWEPTKLERQLDIFRRHPEVGLVAGRYFEEEPGSPRVSRDSVAPEWFDRVLNTNGEDAFRLATMVWTGTVMIRRAALGAERFVSGLEPAEDRDLWVRITSRHPCYLIGDPLATAVLVEGSLSRTHADRDYGNMLRVVYRNAELLGKAGVRRWETKVYGSWAACHLGDGNAVAAMRPALKRLSRQPWSAQAWWIVAKSAILAAVRRGNNSPEA
jgi:glycosyltransferase involved in cell wall biosynthesis